MTHYIKITGKAEIISSVLKDSTADDAIMKARKLWAVVDDAVSMDVYTDQNHQRKSIKSYVKR